MGKQEVSIYDIIKRIFPSGTQDIQNTNGDKTSNPAWDTPPVWPPDVFAVSAYLLERSGLYAFLTPGTENLWGDPWFVISAYDRERWQAASNQWKKAATTPDVVTELWVTLIHEGKKAKLSTVLPMVRRNSSNSYKAIPPIPDWVKAAVGLLIIADEACSDVGYVLDSSSNDEGYSWMALQQARVERAFIERLKKEAEHKAKQPNATVTLSKHLNSITQIASLDLVAVLPKNHTSQVGTTLRSITHNLALLPPPSRMAATWSRITGTSIDSKELNILLVPLPYVFDENSFKTKAASASIKDWAWFEVLQNWLPEEPHELCNFVAQLIEKAEAVSKKKVHVLVFPEFSLTWDHFECLIKTLPETFNDLEFLVSGSSVNCESVEGNYVLTSSITRLDDKPITYTNSRGKHHRWRLDENQLKNYDLFQFREDYKYLWEDLGLHQRQIHTHVFRNNSCFTTLICEDLARSDPAHEVVRAIGPSIVFSLLMDGPQIPSRWSARYAEGLVEDPGSAVLTFTSRALINRTFEKNNREFNTLTESEQASGEKYPKIQNWSVALWRDSEKRVELHCPPNDHGVLLTLKSRPLDEKSYDGRHSTEGVSWHFDSSQSVQLDRENAALTKLLSSTYGAQKK